MSRQKLVDRGKKVQPPGHYFQLWCGNLRIFLRFEKIGIDPVALSAIVE